MSEPKWTPAQRAAIEDRGGALLVSAAAGSIAGIAWLDGADDERIAQAVSNTLANVSGILCDGAKPSCAAKIASSVLRSSAEKGSSSTSTGRG